MATSRIPLALLCVSLSLSTATLPVAAQDAQVHEQNQGHNHGQDQQQGQAQSHEDKPAHARDVEEADTHSNDSSEAPESSADTNGAPQAALDHYMLGRRHYLAGRYREALAELKAALEIDRNAPDLLYNVARVYENLNEFDQAIAYYQRYLAAIPLSDTEERDHAEKTIRRLQGAKHEIALSPKPQRTQPAQPVPTHIGRADLAFWIAGGAALALLAGGATCGLLALRKYDAVGSFVVGADGNLGARNDLSRQAKRFALLADGLFIGSGVALTTAALLFLLRDAEQPQQEANAWHFGLNLGAHRAHLSLTAHF